MITVLLVMAAPLFVKATDLKPDLLQKAAVEQRIEELCKEPFRPLPVYSDRAYWESVPDLIRRQTIERAEQRLDYVWKSVTMTSYLDFARNGARVPNDSHMGERLGVLSDLVMGEMLEGKGRFMDAIGNGVWSICEQSTWVTTAHIYWQLSGTAIPDVDSRFIDLSGSRYAANMAWVYYLLGEELGKLSPTIPKRMRDELNRHTFDIYLQRDDMFWLGFREGAQVNNWNPYCNFHVVTAALLAEEDAERRTAIVKKSMRSVDQFINYFEDDGGCEEGPSYWGMAAAMLDNYLKLLSDYTDGQLDIYDNQRVKNIGLYIANAHIDSTYYVNFADAEPKAGPSGLSIFRYGQHIKDSSLMKFGAYNAMMKNFAERPGGGNIDEQLKVIEVYNDLNATEPVAPYYRSVWMDGIEVAVARTKAGTPKGLTLAMKGGFNNESHNHNDIGNFILYADGRPIIVDAGVGTYVAATFDHRRYTIWNMQSQFHNVPVINGVQQKEGAQYRAKDVRFTDNGRTMKFRLDIAGAYPEEAACREWIRDFTFDRGRNTVTLTETYTLAEQKGEVILNFMTCAQVDRSTNGKAIFTSEGRTLVMHFDPARYELSVEDAPQNDERLTRTWGVDHLTRVSLKVKNPGAKGSLKVTFSQK